LPDILAAARAGRHMVQLGDGTQGMLPLEWLAEHGLLAGMAQMHGDHLRFRASQAALLDSMLRQQTMVDVDAQFQQAREKLDKFQSVQSLEPAPTFAGSLRSYQREGLGWLDFLRWFGMGGILADDMGLGKTVQVLALLDRLRQEHVDGNGDAQPHRPCLVVSPRSVVFNWIDEATRFAPHLRLVTYTGGERETLRRQFDQADLIVTSYGLMRRDIRELREQKFRYVILDEAQAIKNPMSQSAKAARLLDAEHRLALTGTPVENHLGDLWSIFEFLNPGMLGSGTRFAEMVRGGAPAAGDDGEAPPPMTAMKQGDEAIRIAKALRPFILRRTKRQVLDDLPEKTEQTIVCEMPRTQRKIYDQIRKHYRSTLLRQWAPGASGMGGSAMMVLEALLRLRQACCHPGLIDPKMQHEPAVKLETLLDSLSELIDEGSKALVFSQFTSMLSLVRKRLDEMGIVYEYLDGQTRKRKQRVERFQNDPKCPVFLISLKAGGLGLNLTAAEYVFILDPWWNPAVEAQAIDRTYRIGQTRRVFAYRLICKDTVEQRIIDLQQRKKELADAIVDGQQNLLRQLTREDLEALLS
jgi:SNF2 family DNA or RNA helicase